MPAVLRRQGRWRAEGRIAHQGHRRYADGQRDECGASERRCQRPGVVRRQHRQAGSQCGAGNHRGGRVGPQMPGPQKAQKAPKTPGPQKAQKAQTNMRRLIASLGLAVAISVGVTANDGAPIANAAMNADREAVRTLLKKGLDVNEAQGDGTTALHWAAIKGDADMAQMLIYAGANVRATT